MCPVRRTVRRGAAASERKGVVALRGGGVESVGMRAGEAERRRGRETEMQRDGDAERRRGRETEMQRDGDAERRRCRETERRRLGRKKIFFENNFDFSEIRVIFVRS